MQNSIIYHNPRCSKSRQTLALLEEQNINVEIVEYLKTPLSYQDLQSLSESLDITSVLDMVRVKEPEFKEAGLTKESNNDTLLHAIVQYPKLLERPIVVYKGKAAIGRPPENVLKLFV